MLFSCFSSPTVSLKFLPFKHVSSKFLRMRYTSGRLMTYKHTNTVGIDLANTGLAAFAPISNSNSHYVAINGDNKNFWARPLVFKRSDC